MKISKDKVVTLTYTVLDSEGTAIISNQESRPLQYLHGYQNIVPGIEKVLDNNEVGFTASITLPPQESYGDYQENALINLPRQHFPKGLHEGMEFHVETKNGFTSMSVIEFDEKTVTLDSNHPLAGKTLQFVVEVLAVRDANEQELIQKHVDWH